MKRVSILSVMLVAVVILAACGNEVANDTGPTEDAGVINQSNAQSTANASTEGGQTCVMSDEAILEHQQFREAMYCTTKLFPWPPGYQVDSSRVDEWVEAHEGWEQAGWNVEAQYQLPFSRFACVWELEYLYVSSQGDEQRVKIAYETLTTTVAHPAQHIAGFPSDAIPERSSAGYAERAELANMGDTSVMAEHVRNNCTGYTYPETQP